MRDSERSTREPDRTGYWDSCSERDRLNEALHRMIDVEPCETACTHVLVGQWFLRNGKFT